jgi:GDPmannose 4,6-dehydratase
MMRPEDFVSATGETSAVRHCVEIAFDQTGVDWEQYVKIDDALKRRAQGRLRVGDPAKAKRVLGWEPSNELRAVDPHDGRRGLRVALQLRR